MSMLCLERIWLMNTLCIYVLTAFIVRTLTLRMNCEVDEPLRNNPKNYELKVMDHHLHWWYKPIHIKYRRISAMVWYIVNIPTILTVKSVKLKNFKNERLMIWLICRQQWTSKLALPCRTGTILRDFKLNCEDKWTLYDNRKPTTQWLTRSQTP